MKTVRGGILILISALAITVLFFFFPKINRHTKQEPPATPRITTENSVLEAKQALTNNPTRPQSLTLRAANMSEEQKAEVAEKFKEKFKPTVEKWFNVYKGRVPFRLEDFTLDKFHSRFGDYLYTFMINLNTFTIQDSKLGLNV